jgi:hypothetical protein
MSELETKRDLEASCLEDYLQHLLYFVQANKGLIIVHLLNVLLGSPSFLMLVQPFIIIITYFFKFP